MNASQTKERPSIGDVLAAAGFAIGLITAWLYLAGWTYAYHYFDRFGIPLLMVDIPKENYFVYGGIVVSHFPVWGLIIGMAVLAVVYSWRWLADRLSSLMVPFGLLVVLAAFWLGHQAAIAAAHEQYSLQRASDYGAYPRIQVWMKENNNKAADGLRPSSADLAAGCYRLLLHNHDRLFLLRPLKGAAAADLPVVIAPWNQIELVRVLPELHELSVMQSVSLMRLDPSHDGPRIHHRRIRADTDRCRNVLEAEQLSAERGKVCTGNL